jgi:hypothetical protein
MITLSRREANELITPAVRVVLEQVGQQRSAYTESALIDAGVPSAITRVLVATRGPIEKARISVTEQRKRVQTGEYVWGPDVASFLVGIQ